MNIRYLSLEDLLAIAEDLGVPKVRDLGLLDSAAHRPRASFMGHDAYPAVHDKAAVLLESVVRNHPLVDGNKRLCWVAAFTFYWINGIDLDAPEDDAYDLVIAASTGAVQYADIADRLAEWTHPRLAGRQL